MRSPLPCLILVVCATLAPAQDFVPIPAELEEVYRYDPAALYFGGEELPRQDCEAQLAAVLDELEGLRGRLGEDPAILLGALESLERVRVLSSRLIITAFLEYAPDTSRVEDWNAARDLSSRIDQRLAFVATEIQGLSDENLTLFLAREPNLGGFYHYLREVRRDRAHTLGLAEEELLATLSEPLVSWSEDLYQSLARRLEFEVEGSTYTTENDLARFLRSPDRALREEAYRAYYEGLAEDADLYAVTLFHKIRNKNALARLRHFDDAVHQSLHGLHLSVAEFDSTLVRVRAQAALYKRYQTLLGQALKAELGLEQLEPWDMRVSLTEDEPRFTVTDALELVKSSLAVLDLDYEDQLEALFDPEARRLDLSGDGARYNGAFAWGPSGADWVFFCKSFHGYFSDVSTLAHEAGHAVHAGLIKDAGVSPLYDDGPRYFTEGFAMVNELLLLQHCLGTATDPDQRLFYLRELCSQLTATIRLARYVLFEAELYRREARGELTAPEQISGVWEELAGDFDIFAGRVEATRHGWARVPHFYTHPLYNTNYVFANLLATLLYTRLVAEPEAVEAYIELLEGGFPDVPAQLLERYLDVSLSDPAQQASAFAEITRQLDALEASLAVPAGN